MVIQLNERVIVMNYENTPGTVQVYTGNGKGKTTAAFGLALRALGHGKKVGIVQFMKGDRNYGEFHAIQTFNNVTISMEGKDCFVDRDNPSQEDEDMAQEGLNKADKMITSNDFDLIILDEINVAIFYNLVTVNQVVNLINKKPKKLELVLTGRYARQEIIEMADLVSEIQEIKHHFRSGIGMRKGVEY